MYTDLSSFTTWWLSTKPINPPPGGLLTNDKDLNGVVLFRDGRFQVELFFIKPNSEVVDHIHPNVDSYEYYISGDIVFRKNGKEYVPPGPGFKLHVPPTAWHGGTIGPRGVYFYSIQHWVGDVEPEFIGNDWTDNNGAQNYLNS